MVRAPVVLVMGMMMTGPGSFGACAGLGRLPTGSN